MISSVVFNGLDILEIPESDGTHKIEERYIEETYNIPITPSQAFHSNDMVDYSQETLQQTETVTQLPLISEEEMFWNEATREQEYGVGTSVLEEKLSIIKEEKEEMYAEAVQQEGIVTINTLYASCYKGNQPTTTTKLEQRVIHSLVERTGLSVTEETSRAAELLAKYSLQVTEKNINKIQNLQMVVKQLEYEEKIAQEFEEHTGIPPMDEKPLMEGNTVLYSKDQMDDIVRDLTETSDEVIVEALVEDGQLTIEQLKAKKLEYTKRVLQGEQIEVVEHDLVEHDVVAVKQQIRTICSKLSVEAARKLSEKLPIESVELSRLAEELVAYEQEEIQLAIDALPKAEQKMTTNQVTQILEQVQVVRRNEAMLPVVVKEPQITLEGLRAYSQRMEVEQGSVQPPINYLEESIYKLLREQKVKITDNSVNAVKALLAGNMEINQDVLKETIPVVAMVEQFLQDTTPQVVVQMLHEGKNVNQMSLGEIVQWEQQHKLPQMKASLAATILSLEENHQITPAEKEEMIAFYKVLHNMEENQEEILGYMMKHKVPLTVEHAKEACTVISKEATSEVKPVGKQLETMLLKVAGIGGMEDKNWFHAIEQQVKQYAREVKQKEHLPKSVKEKLAQVQGISSEVVQQLEKQGFPVTLNTLAHMNQWNESTMDGALTDAMEYQAMVMGEEWNEFPITLGLSGLLEQVKQTISSYERRVNREKDHAVQKGNMAQFQQKKKVGEALGFQKHVLDEMGVYQVPFQVNGEQKLVQLYIPSQRSKKNVSEETCIGVSYETKHMGEMIAQIKVGKNSIQYRIIGSTDGVTQKIRQKEEQLVEKLHELGYHIKDSTVTLPTKEESKNRLKRLGSLYFEEIV